MSESRECVKSEVLMPLTLVIAITDSELRKILREFYCLLSYVYVYSFLFVIEHMMPLCMVISWVYSVAMMIQHIVAEKEHRLKEVSVESL